MLQLIARDLSENPDANERFRRKPLSRPDQESL